MPQLAAYLREVPGLIEALDAPCFVSFGDSRARIPVRRPFNLRDQGAPEHRQPYLRYSPTLLEFGINWTDNRRGDGRAFLEWALATFACDGQDDHGYRYAGYARCHSWLDHWLPKR